MELREIASTVMRLLMAPPANLLLLLGAAWLLRRRWPRTARALGTASTLLLIALSTSAGARLLMAPLENQNAPFDVRSVSGAQAIVLLGAGSIESAPEYGGAEVPDQVALVRMAYAAHLQHATGLPLLVSGAGGAPARMLRDEFRTPVQWIEDQSTDTAQNAANSARMLKAAGIKRVLLVTHAMHMPRASAEFRRQGIEVVAAPTLFYSRAAWSPGMLVPSASGLYRSFYAYHEWVGLLWYRLRGPAPAAP